MLLVQHPGSGPTGADDGNGLFGMFTRLGRRGRGKR
jgi:hypothetical protein